MALPDLFYSVLFFVFVIYLRNDSNNIIQVWDEEGKRREKEKWEGKGGRKKGKGGEWREEGGRGEEVAVRREVKGKFF